MSVALTTDAVRSRQKTVTRRHVDSWRKVKPGDRLTLIEKGMGLKKGEKQVVICQVEIVNVGDEPLLDGLNEAEIVAEGFPDWPHDVTTWAMWWANGHGVKSPKWEQTHERWPEVVAALAGVMCRRIEWRYLDEVAA